MNAVAGGGGGGTRCGKPNTAPPVRVSLGDWYVGVWVYDGRSWITIWIGLH